MKLKHVFIVGSITLAHSLLAFSIINGNLARDSDFFARSTVAIASRSSYLPEHKTPTVNCTGSIIGENFVLTAAHCLRPFDAQIGSSSRDVKIVFGLDANDTKAPSVSVLAFAFSDRFKKFYGGGWEKEGLGDIALLYFEGKIPEGFAPAKLLPPDRKIGDEEKIIVAGYGYHIKSNHDESTKGILRWARYETHKDHQFTETEVTTWPSEDPYAYSADSGGPAYLFDKGAYYLFGVARRLTDNTNEKGQPGEVYTNINTYRSWISINSEYLRHLDQPDLSAYKAWTGEQINHLKAYLESLNIHARSSEEVTEELKTDRNLRSLKGALDSLEKNKCDPDSFHEYAFYSAANEAIIYVSVDLMGAKVRSLLHH